MPHVYVVTFNSGWLDGVTLFVRLWFLGI